MAHLVRGRLPRLGAAAAALTFLGTLGFLGMQALGLARIIVLDDPGAAARLGEHPLGLLVVAPFLIGMFGGLALLTAGLFRVPGVPRWIPAAFAIFWLLDLAVGGVGPVDPHWLFLAGSIGLAVSVLRAGDRGWAAARL